jgi:hypothetical protein
MRKISFVLISFLVSGLFMFALTTQGYSQAKTPDILLSFQRQSDGKVAQKNAANEKIFTFYIKGLKTQADVDHFTSKFVNKQHVVLIRIPDLLPDGQRKGQIVLDQTAKVPDFQALLKGAGINTISIDGELKSVDELGKDKKGQGSTKQK